MISVTAMTDDDDNDSICHRMFWFIHMASICIDNKGYYTENVPWSTCIACNTLCVNISLCKVLVSFQFLISNIVYKCRRIWNRKRKQFTGNNRCRIFIQFTLAVHHDVWWDGVLCCQQETIVCAHLLNYVTRDRKHRWAAAEQAACANSLVVEEH